MQQNKEEMQLRSVSSIFKRFNTKERTSSFASASSTQRVSNDFDRESIEKIAVAIQASDQKQNPPERTSERIEERRDSLRDAEGSVWPRPSRTDPESEESCLEFELAGEIHENEAAPESRSVDVPRGPNRNDGNNYGEASQTRKSSSKEMTRSIEREAENDTTSVNVEEVESKGREGKEFSSSGQELCPRQTRSMIERSVSFCDDQEQLVQLPDRQIRQILNSLCENEPFASSVLLAALNDQNEPRERVRSHSESMTLADQIVHRSREQLPKIFVKWMTQQNLADDDAMACAEKVLERYISPEFEENELDLIMESERALEEELLGIDRKIDETIPEAIQDKLYRRAKAVTAAEAIAGNGVQAIQPTESSRSSIRTVRICESAESISESGIPQSCVSPNPRNDANDAKCHQNEKDRVSKLQGELARRISANKEIEFDHLTSVYDRNCNWLKKAESKVQHAQHQKSVENLKECSFRPNLISMNYNEDTSVCPKEFEGLSRRDSACLRLYRRARELHAKQYHKAEQFIYNEQKAFLASTPRARPLPSKVYGHLCPSETAQKGPNAKTKPLPTGVEECTFHPKTNVKRKWTANKGCGDSFWSRGDFSRAQEIDKTLHRQNNDSDPANELNVETQRNPTASKDIFEDIEHQNEVRHDSAAEEDHGLNTAPDGVKENEKGNVHDHERYSAEIQAISREASRLNDRYKLIQRVGSTCLKTDVDFSEFLHRQETFNQNKNAKIEAIKNRKGRGIELAPGTKRILKNRQTQIKAAQSDAESLAGVEGASRKCASFTYRGSIPSVAERYKERPKSAMDAEYPFSPRITRKAKKLKKRTIEDFLRRSQRTKNQMETHRLERDLKEQMQLTFKPQINKNNHVRSRLNLRNPDAYMKTVREQQEEKYRKEVQATQEREEAELKLCTFRPQIASNRIPPKTPQMQLCSPKIKRNTIPAYPSYEHSLKHQQSTV